jgi:putative molybdopterin biosynthesis protein
MEKTLASQISDSILQDILNGKIKPGEKLPSIRGLTKRWNCTVGTVQRAYHELARQGIITSRPGQGSQVVSRPPVEKDRLLRTVSLIHKAEEFLLESIHSGHSPEEIEQAIRLALDRWRSVEKNPEPSVKGILRFGGSHDLVVTWLAAHFDEIVPGWQMQVAFSGSLGGLIALSEGKVDLAGCHLWDEESDSYNIPFIKKLFPNQNMAYITLCHRRLGLILPAGNPQQIHSLAELTKPGIIFINRQAGSGTRVWLDAQLHKVHTSTDKILGYENEKATHSEVAREIAEGNATVGVGLEASARQYGLDFIFLTRERYDLVFQPQGFDAAVSQALLAWVSSKQARSIISGLGGYEASTSGNLQFIN